KPDSVSSVAAAPGIIVAVVGLSAVLMTGAIVLADTAVAPWSPARLNVEALVHRKSGCGLADHLPDGRELAHSMAEPAGRSILDPSISIYFPCAKIPRIEGGRVGLPNILGIWFDEWPVSKKDSPFQAATDLYHFHLVAQKRN